MKAKFIALAALVLGLASCQTDVVDGVKVDANGEAPVTLQVGLPEDVTRAAGANSAKGAIGNISLENYDIRYILGVYDVNGNLAKRIEQFEDVSTKTTFNLRLVPGRHYRFVVWADFVNEDTTVALHYDASDLTDVKLTKNMGDNQPMDESRDAYTGVFNTETDGNGKVFSSTSSINITLTRPFAKLRVVTNDMKELYSGLATATVKYNTPLYTSFNALTATPDEPENNVVKEVDYSTMVYENEANPLTNGVQTLFADYFFGTEDGKVHFTLDVKDNAGFAIPQVAFNTDIPVQRNYLTTIMGPILTDPNTISVEINEAFTNGNEWNPEEDDYDIELWDGTTKTEVQPTTNAVTGEPEYVVSSASELAWLADLVNNPTTRATATELNIVLEANIDLNNKPWTAIGTEENYFTGTFDGNGHSIKNLNIEVAEAKEGKAYIGFFGYAKNAEIKDVTFENVYLNIACLDIDHSQGHIGAVAGSLEGTSTIEDVTVKGDIKVESTVTANGASRVAVVAGGNSYGNVTMKNVHVRANEGSYLKANNNVGALAGQLQGVSKFENCSSNIDVTGTKFFAGGIIGLAAGDQTFTNCHTTGNITITAGREGKAHDHYRVGGIAGGWADGAKNVCTLTNCSYTGNLSGTNADGSVAEAFDYAGYVGRGYTLNGCKGSKVVIDGVEYVQAYNNAAEAGVYYVNGVLTVSTASALKVVATRVNSDTDCYDGETIVLGADIDLKNENWTPIGYWTTFNGTFDGQNHTISNLKHHGTEEDCYVGLFGYTENATIKNLTINNVDLKLVANASWAGGHMGALVGNIAGETIIENITVTGDVKIDGNKEMAGAGRIGGVVGGNVAKVSFKNVVVDANAGSFVQGNTSIGGIAGQIQQVTTFENCSANIDVTAQAFYAGGIVGLAYQNTSFTNCVTSGKVSVLAGREGNNNDLYRIGAIAGGWDDHENLTLVLEGCSTTCELFGASVDGRTATAFDCAGYVGRGYSAVVGAKVSVNGTVYEYAGEGVYKIGDSYVVNTGDALVAALAQKYNVTFGRDLKIDPANMSNAYGKTGVLVYNGQTIDGAGYKLDVKGAGGTWDSGICTSGGLIKDIWVTGSFRGVFVKGATHVEKVVLDNVRIEGTTYTISIDQASGQGLEATNSIFRGWTSYAATIGNVKFDGCTFGAGNGYNFSRPYAPTEYVNCVFEAGHQIDPRAAVTFENCTFNGVALTADNLSTLVTSNIANASVK